MSAENISLWLGILAGIIQLVGYWLYTKSLLQSNIRPNTASWFIWAYGAVIEFTSYFQMTGDVVKNILPFACTTGCMVTFLVIWKRGRFQRLKAHEYICIGIDLASLVVWWAYQSATYAFLVSMVSVFVSFVPMWKEVWDEPTSESPLPWMVWCTAYFTATVVIVMRFEKWEDLVYSAGYLVCCIPVLLISRFKNR